MGRRWWICEWENKKNFVNACIIRQTRARTLTNDFEAKKKKKWWTKFQAIWADYEVLCYKLVRFEGVMIVPSLPSSPSSSSPLLLLVVFLVCCCFCSHVLFLLLLLPHWLFEFSVPRLNVRMRASKKLSNWAEVLYELKVCDSELSARRITAIRVCMRVCECVHLDRSKSHIVYTVVHTCHAIRYKYPSTLTVSKQMQSTMCI